VATSSFSQLKGTRLYLPAGVVPANARSGYLLAPPATNPPPSITLSDSLQTYAGVYLLFPSLPETDNDPSVLAGFIAAVETFLGSPAQQSTRWLWITNPQTARAGLIATSLQSTLQGGAVTTLMGDFIKLAPNISLRISGGTTIAVSSDGTSLVFTAASGAPNVLLVTPRGLQPARTIALAGDLTLALFEGTASSGCFTLGLAPVLDELAVLGVGLRYFASDLNPEDPPGFVRAFPYPIFALKSGETLPLSGVLDPLAALDPERTFFQVGDGGNPSPIASYFRSGLNSPVTLLPHADARLLFAIDVIAETKDATPDPSDPYYLTPSGSFDIVIANAGSPTGQFANYLLPGFSGVEYFPLTEGKSVMTFKPSYPAFSPAVAQPNPSDRHTFRPAFKGLTRQALTSWAYLDNSEAYFAQPDSAVMFRATTDFMTYLPVLSGQLTPPSGDVIQAFPMAPYAGVDLASEADYPQFESQVLNPARRNALYKINPVYSSAMVNPVTQPGATPQGLLLQLQGSVWEMLTLAQTPAASGVSVPCQLSDVKGPLQAALQTNQLFMVVSSGSKLLKNASIPNYQLTVQSFTDLEQSQNPVVPEPIRTKLLPLQGRFYTSITNYQSDLQQALGSDYATYAALLVQVGASFGLTIQSWNFDVSPYYWPNYKTLLIFKFTNAPFANLVDDTGSWAQAAELNDDPVATQQDLRSFIEDAQSSSDPNLDYFKTTVLNDPTWNGMLILRCRVPLSGLPAQIEGLAAGIDPSQFFAHHVGITVTPVMAGASPTLQNSTLFGLISYNDPSNLAEADTDYQFKVQNLSVLFVNSEIANFSSLIELLSNSLFGEPSTLLKSSIGNNIQLNGVYQQHGDGGSYIFQSRGNNVFQMTSQVLGQVVINQAQFVTLVSPGGVKAGQPVQTRFILAGYLAFQALPGFDIFSFGSDSGAGGLVYTNLFVDLSFPPDTPSYKTFAFDATKINFNTAVSLARPNSLYPRFPLKLTGFIQASNGQTPPTLNYMPVDSVLNGSQLNGTWFGLVFDLNLGSLGALAGEVGFVASLLLSWQPNPKVYTVYLGLQIPGATGGKREISIEGVLKLTFGDLRFVVAGPGAYILQLRNIALSLLSISFPPGQTDILLFGDPGGQDNSTLGWYAAYLKPNSGGGSSGGNGSKMPARSSSQSLLTSTPTLSRPANQESR
jgi:hypothetical protein